MPLTWRGEFCGTLFMWYSLYVVVIVLVLEVESAICVLDVELERNGWLTCARDY